LVLFLTACDTTGDAEESQMNVTVEVEGLAPYTFSEPATAALQPVPGASTQVLSLRLNEQPSADNRIGLHLDLEANQLVADSTYVLYSVIDPNHIGDGEPSMWARFFDCPVNQVGFCERDYYAISGEATLFFIEIIALTEARVEGAFGFIGLSTANPSALPKVNGTFSVPLEQ
jgi:hypothetical protein